MMQETEGNSFDTSRVEGRYAEINTLLNLKYATEEHRERFLDGVWAGLDGYTARTVVESSQEGCDQVKAILRGLVNGTYPAVYIENDKLQLG